MKKYFSVVANLETGGRFHPVNPDSYEDGEIDTVKRVICYGKPIMYWTEMERIRVQRVIGRLYIH